MNWFKLAQIKETLPYFEEFADMGDYVPNESRLMERLQRGVGASIVSVIGSGDSGVAYLLSNGDVLKITTNAQEGRVAMFFLENPNPHVVKYKQIWKDGDLFFIVMERIDSMASSKYGKEFDYIEKLLDSKRCYNPHCAYGVIEQDKIINSDIKKQILSYISYLKNINYKVFDFLNINNIGIKDGRLIFFDVT